MSGEKHIRMKVLVIGDRNVGKTTLVRRITERRFVTDVRATVGADFHTHSWEMPYHAAVGGPLEIIADFTDIMGQDSIPYVQRYMVKGTDAILVVCSYPVSKESLRRTGQWIHTAQKMLEGAPVPFFLLVNKSDLCGVENGCLLMKNYDPILARFTEGSLFSKATGGSEGDGEAEAPRSSTGGEPSPAFDARSLEGFAAVSAKESTNLPAAPIEFLQRVALNMDPSRILQRADLNDAPKYTTVTRKKKKSTFPCCAQM